MKLQNRLALLGLSLVFVGGFVFSQIYIHNRNRKDLKEIAQELALTWQKKLSLTDAQVQMLENSIVKFTYRKNKIINSNYLQNKKIIKLKQVQQKEHLKLQKFLSDPQFDAYITLNKRVIKPILEF